MGSPFPINRFFYEAVCRKTITPACFTVPDSSVRERHAIDKNIVIH